MRNELMLLVSLLLAFGGTLAWFALMGKAGLMGWTVLATIAANIEVLILVAVSYTHLRSRAPRPIPPSPTRTARATPSPCRRA